MADKIIPILMPKWGLSMQEGKLDAWHVEEGTMLSVGDAVMEVETDKISNTVEAFDAGCLRRIVGQAGQVYPVQTLLGILADKSVTEKDIDSYIADYAVPTVVSTEEGGDMVSPSDFLDTDLGRLRYNTYSRPDQDENRLPILLIHGFGGDLDNWLFNSDQLAQSTEVFSLDLPGHGQSTCETDQPDIDTMVKAVSHFLEIRQLRQVHLVGHSMGGAIAGLAASRHPNVVKALSLISPLGMGKEVNVSYLRAFLAAKTRRELKPCLKDLFANPSRITRGMIDDILHYKRLDRVENCLQSLMDSLISGDEQSQLLVELLEELSIPIQILWGALDAIIPVSHAHAISHAKVIVVENSGHMLQMEDPKVVNKAIIELNTQCQELDININR